MNNVTHSPQQRTAFAIIANDGTTGTVRRVDNPTVFGLPARHRQYDVLLDLGNGDLRQYEFTRPMMKMVLRSGAKITGRVV